MTGSAETVIGLDLKRMNAMVARDGDMLRALLADDLIYTHSSARLDTKQTMIRAMESGVGYYTRCEPSDVKAQEFGDVVVLTGVCAISIMQRKKPSSFTVRFTDVWAKRDGDWRMVTWQSTKLGE